MKALIDSVALGAIIQKRAECPPDCKVIVTHQGLVIIKKSRIDKIIERIFSK